jgi:hypothetical protein
MEGASVDKIVIFFGSERRFAASMRRDRCGEIRRVIRWRRRGPAFQPGMVVCKKKPR